MLMLSGILGVAVLGSVLMIAGEDASDTEENESPQQDDLSSDAEHDQDDGALGDLLAIVDPVVPTAASADTDATDDETDTEISVPPVPTQASDDMIAQTDDPVAPLTTISTSPIPAPVQASAATVDFPMGSVDADASATSPEETHQDGGARHSSDIPDHMEGDDTVMGTDGHDIMSAGEGDSTTELGAGNDAATGAGGNDLLSGGDGNDTLQGEEGFDLLFGDAGNDRLYRGADNDTLYGGHGNDTLMGGLGEDLALGGADGDSISGGAGDDTLVGGGGNDIVMGGEDDDSLLGSAGKDTLNGDRGDDILIGDDDAEADFLNGGDGDDSIHAGRGDVVHGGSGADTIFLRHGEDVSLVDFTSGEDILQLEIEGNPAAAEIEFTYDETIDMTLIFVNGTTAAALYGDVTLTADDVTLVAA